MTSRIGAHAVVSLVAATVSPPVAWAQCCLSSSGCFCDLGGTIKDNCTGLQWEKKAASADRHGVDNKYSFHQRERGDRGWSLGSRSPTSLSRVTELNAEIARVLRGDR